MKKQVRSFNISYALDWCYGTSIEEIRKDLDEIEKLGATHIEIEPGAEYDMPYVNITPITERLETDEEFNKRVEIIRRRENQQKDRELRELERLKNKYNV